VTTTRRRTPTRARQGADLGLRVAAAAGLLVSGYIHLHLAPGYSLIGEQITEGTLFRAQAVAAVLAALALLARRTRLSWLPAALVSAGSLAALVGSVYVHVPAVGPFPPVYEPIWYAEKVVAVLSVTVALVAALAGMTLDAGRPASARAAGRR